jgi:hypothetical protein
VQSTAVDVDPATFKVTVRGVGGGSDLTNLTFTPCQGVAFCRQANVNLWEPDLNAFSGSFAVEVTGNDQVGNPGSGIGSIPVTRWKWAFFDASAGTIRVSPALGSDGTVYFGTSSLPASWTGKVFALAPEGTKKWEKSTGAIEGSPAVGSAGGTETLYVAGNAQMSTTLYALNGATGAARVECAQSNGRVVSAAAVLETTVASAPVETGLFVVNGIGTAVGVRPATNGCVSSNFNQNTPPAIAGGSLLAENDSTGHFYFPTSGNRMVKYPLGGTAAVWNTANIEPVVGMAIVGNDVLGSGGSTFNRGGIYPVSRTASGSNVAVTPLAGTQSSLVYPFIADSAGVLYFGREFEDAQTTSRQNGLSRYTLSPAGLSHTAPGVGVIQAAPVLGSDGRLYTFNNEGQLAVWKAADLAIEWALPGLEANAGASPTLDCSRKTDGTGAQESNRPGVLYVAGGSRLYSFIVDSPRMPLTGWPKYQHDARNSGNPATPITTCQ